MLIQEEIDEFKKLYIKTFSPVLVSDGELLEKSMKLLLFMKHICKTCKDK